MTVPRIMPGRVQDGQDGYIRPYRALQGLIESYLASLIMPGLIEPILASLIMPGHVNPGLAMSILDLVILDLRSEMSTSEI